MELAPLPTVFRINSLVKHRKYHCMENVTRNQKRNEIVVLILLRINRFSLNIIISFTFSTC